MARLDMPKLSPKTPFLRRLGFYLLGVAIGLMMVGLIVSLRSQFLGPGPQSGGLGTPSGAAPGAPR